MTASLTKWYQEHGRHEIFAGNKEVPLAEYENYLVLNEEHVNAKAQDDLDRLGIPKYARDEKKRARDAKLQQDPEYHKRMEKLYRKHVLKEPEAEPLIQIGASSTPLVEIETETREEVGAMGD